MTASSSPSTKRPRRVRFAPAAVVAGVLASAAIATSMTGTLGAFTASILNSQNNTATGTLTMQESNSGGTVTCNSTDGTNNNVSTNSYTCSGINKYGGSTTMIPGTAINTSVTIKNTGTVAANTFTLQPGACSQSNSGSVNGSATDLCAKIKLTLTETITTGGTTSSATTPINGIYLGSLSTSTPYTMTGPIPAGSTANFTFSLTLDSAAGNTYQGLQAAQQLNWTFTS